MTPVSVVCDALLTSPLGINTLQKPCFLQEFKKGKDTQNGTEGQMLIAMLIAQTLNNDQQPLYRCYYSRYALAVLQQFILTK